MTAIAADRMASRLTVPFERGADRLGLGFRPGSTASQARFAPYDFGEHRARHEAEPAPRYVLTALRDLEAPVEVTVAYQVVPPIGPPTSGSATVTVPAGSVRGTSVAFDLGPDEGPATFLRALSVSPGLPAGAVADSFTVTALLGTTAKLLWVLGVERDTLRSFLDHVRSQRDLGHAVGHTLDLVGFDLAVPRFPPLPYAVEDGTVALYHLEDAPGGQVRDTTSRFGGIGHPSSSVTAQARAVGRFGSGFAFRAADAEIVVNNHVEFALGAASSFTAECFVKPDDGDWQGDLLSKHADPGDRTRAGWALSVGSFGRGIDRNLRLVVSDGAVDPVVLFADLTLETGSFHHVAAVIDRGAQEARLWVDGEVRALGPIGGLGGLTNAEPVRIGRAGSRPAAVFQGTIDEVRLSRAARTAFHPVLGESDEGYRRRLRIFRRWTLPTPANLQRTLNEVAGTVAGIADPFVVDDTNATLAGGSRATRIFPVELAPDQSIDATGGKGTPEAAAVGTPADDQAFDPALLVDGTDPRADFPRPAPPVPGATGPAANPRRMRPGLRRALRALLDELAAQGVPGKLRVAAGFDPAAPDLRSVGRALLLTHPGLDPGRLGVTAHRAGCSWVQFRADDRLVYAAVSSTEVIDLDLHGGTATPEHGFDLLVGQTLELRVAPRLPNDASYRWSTIACGEGGADLPARRDLPQTTITATRPGDLAVEVQVNLGVRSFTAMLRLRVGIQSLPASSSISAAGALGVPESVAGDPDDGFFDPAYLITFDDPRVGFARGVETRRMQPGVAEHLAGLLDLITAAAIAGTPRVVSAWTPGTTDLAGVGRALTLEVGSLPVPLARLAALAHAAGFAFVGNDGSRLEIRHGAGDPLAVLGPDEADEGSTATFAVTQRAAPEAVTLAGPTLFMANTGTDTVSAIDTRDGAVRWVAKVGARPAAVAADPAGGRVYTADRASATVTALDAAAGTVLGRIALAGEPSAIAHHPTDPALFVTLPTADTVARIDTSTMNVTGTATVAGRPVALAIHPTAPEAWVATAAGAVGVLRVVDTTTMAVSPAIRLPGPATDLAVNAGRAFVCVPSARTLVVIDVAARAVENSFTDLGPAPRQVAMVPAGSAVFVADADEGRLYVRVATGKPQPPPAPPSVPAGRLPVDVAADDRRVYVANRPVGAAGGADTVSVLDAGAGLALAAVWGLGTGHGERLTWSLRALDSASARLSSTTAPEVDLAAVSAGSVLVQAAYLWPDNGPPYTFEVRLSPQLVALEQAGTPVVIRKDQYDLVMNMLNELHPTGIEVITRVVREHVIELRESLLEVFPGYTFPDFHLRGPKPATPPIGGD